MKTSLERQCPLAGALAEEMRGARRELTVKWLDRIAERVSIDRNFVFPTADLLNHVPLLIDGIADFLENPASQITTDTPVVGKAMELGQLRHAQGFDAYEILKEYELLGGILFTHLTNAADQMNEPCEKGDLLECGHRIFQAITTIQQTTTMHFLRLADVKVAERENRLRAFNRAVSHEIKNRIGAILGASGVLQSIPDMAPADRGRMIDLVHRNANELKDTVEDLLQLSRMNTADARQHQHVRLRAAAKEAARSVRDAAQQARVDIRIMDLPDVEVNAAAVELCLTNYLTNAIKYRDRARQERHEVEISGAVEESKGGAEIVVRVRDQGLGVPEEKRGRLFELFFRAHTTVTGAEGTGLGLNIVRDTAESLGGRAWAEFPERGSVFAFSLPARRLDTRRKDEASTLLTSPAPRE